jgi:type II secretory pathway component GspD/PulD (secretin)
MRRIVCSVLLIAVGMVFGAVAGEAMESRTYPMSVFFEEKLYAAAESAGIPCQWDDPEKWDLSVFELLGVDWPEGSSIKRIKSLGTMTVHNTPGNLSKFERILDEFNLDVAQIELDVRFVSAGRAALEAVGYFDTNRVDAAVLQERLMARDDVKLLEAPRIVTRPGEDAVVKHVKEIIYPTDYDVQLNHNAAALTNAAALFATVEPQAFTMRTIGSIVQVTPTLTDDWELIDLELNVQLVGEPEWKDYGAKAKGEGAATYDLPMEQPFIPVFSADTKVSIRPGRTIVLGGVTDSRRKNEDNFTLAFVTARILNGVGEAYAPRVEKGSSHEVRRRFESEGMEAWTCHYVPTFVEYMRMASEKPKTAQENAEEVAETEKFWKEWFTLASGADWPEGAAVHELKGLNRIWVKNTPTNLVKIAKTLEEVYGNALVEFDLRYVEAGQKALSEVGYFGTNRVNAAVLLERLMARDDARLLEAPRVITRPGEEVVLKGVVEYIYPTDYDVDRDFSPRADGTNTVYVSDLAGAAVEPQCFTMREVGTFVQVTPTLTADGKVIDIELDAQLVGEPEWKDYGAKAKWKGAATYDLTMEQPFFPVRASADTKIGVRPGSTCVFGGGADRRKGDEDKFVLIFVTPRLVDP